jgi:hypothetical protein
MGGPMRFRRLLIALLLAAGVVEGYGGQATCGMHGGCPHATETPAP